jgi:hypothetical protein
MGWVGDAKRVASLADATVGALQGAQLAVGALGRALAVAKELDAKHAIKQVDRFFSNTACPGALLLMTGPLETRRAARSRGRPLA